MANSGRKRIPTAIKKAKGTAQKSRLLPNEYKPEVITKLPAPPDHLTDFAKNEYIKVGNKLLSDGLLTQIDMSSFIAYCIEMGTYFEAQQELKDNGRVFKMKGSGYLQQSPWVNIGSNALKNAQSIGSSFGITPSARTKVAGPPAEKQNPIAKLVALHGDKGVKKAQ